MGDYIKNKDKPLSIQDTLYTTPVGANVLSVIKAKLDIYITYKNNLYQH